LRDEKVHFAGYMLPHPLEQDLIIRIQTKPPTVKDPASPLGSLNEAIDCLEQEFLTLEQRFSIGVDKFRAQQEAREMNY
jgi:DNA-directed RNA polymerase subunit L